MPSKLPDELRRRPVQVKLPPALIARCEERAKLLGITKTEFHERALEAALGAPAAAGGVRAADRVSAGAAPPVRPAAPLVGVDRTNAFRRITR